VFARQAARARILSSRTRTEAKVLDHIWRATTSPDEVRAEIEAAIAAGAAQMGPLMKALRDKFGPSLDGKVARRTRQRSAREKIAPHQKPHLILNRCRPIVDHSDQCSLAFAVDA